MTARIIDRHELFADAAIHVLGVAMGVVGAAVLVPRIVQASSFMAGLSIVLYIFGLLAMLSFSAAYNLWPASPRREWLRRLDHSAIFLMIAGTYSPLTLGRVAGAWSLWLAAAVWAIALAGVWLKLNFPRRFDRLAIVLYLALGWLGIFAIGPLLDTMPTAALILVAVGGAIYSAGVAFHVWERLRFHNAIWHGFVLAAAACHYAAIVLIT
ncbi:MAG: hemolysin III family protein [Rhodospirillales bacterium]